MGRPTFRQRRERGKAAVLLLAYGGPDSLDDIPAFLLNVRGGRPTPQDLVDEISERYRRIGGYSPLLSITRSVAAKLKQAIGLPVYVGMRHWRPFIQDVVVEMADDGVEHVTAICMAPHFSSMSIGAYRARLDEALCDSGPHMAVDFIDHWHAQPHYLAGIAANVRQSLERFPSEKRDQVKVAFTAHSLPVSILERGDPYDAQLGETARLLAGQIVLPEDRWTLSYQSAPRTGVRWLGPQIEDLVVDLATAGEENLLIAPIGFISDHVEVLYDIDIGVKEIALAQGVRVERTPMLNDGPALINALASLVREGRS